MAERIQKNLQSAAQAESAPTIDFRQQTYNLLPHLVEPTAEEKEALRVQRGLVFLPMALQSYAQVVAEDQKHFMEGELDYANSDPDLRIYVPPVAVEVGFIEAELALPDSFLKRRGAMFQMIEDYSLDLQREFPNFRAIKLPVAAYASADRAYSRMKPGQVLFKNYFASCLDDISGGAASAGRLGPSSQFGVSFWLAGYPLVFVGAVPAVVKITGTPPQTT